MKKMKFIAPILSIATLSSVAITLVGCSCNKAKEEKITPKLSDKSSEGVKIKDSNIVKGKESTITLTIPDGKVIEKLELTIDNKVLNEGTDYTIDSKNIITIKADVVTGDNVIVKVTVKDKAPEVIKVTSVKIDNTVLQGNVNDEIELKATVLPENATNPKLTWETVPGGSETAKIITHDGKTYLKCLSTGTVEVKATSTDGSDKSDSKTFTVVSKVTGIEISKSSLAMELSGEQEIYATITPEDATNKKVKWEVTEGDANIEIDKEETTSGEKIKITGKQLGEAKIKATSDEDSSFNKTCTVSVKQKIIDASMNKMYEIKPEETTTAELTINPETAEIKSIDWATEETSTIEITPDSTDKTKCSIKGLADGKATLTATITDELGNVLTVSSSIYVQTTPLNEQFTFEDITGQENHVSVKPGATTLENIYIPECDPTNPDKIVTQIKDNGFKGKTGIKTVSLPNTIEKIGTYGFQGCSNLTSINLPEGITELPYKCFDGCKTLVKCDLPSNLKTIAECTFGNCNNLASVTLPSTLKSIGRNAFNSCFKIKKIFVPKSVTFIDTQGFYQCGTQVDGFEAEFEDVNKGDDVTMKIGNNCFQGCSTLKSFVFPTYKKIEGSDTSTSLAATFSGCAKLKNVDLGSLTSIGNYFFKSCGSLSSITIPSSITAIGTDAFTGCNVLKDITVDSTTIAMQDNPGNLFSKLTGRVVKVPEGTVVGSTLSDTTIYTKSEQSEGGYDIYTSL